MTDLRILTAAIALLASGAVSFAQTSPAQMGITPTTTPEVLQVLDKNGTWVPIGSFPPGGPFTPSGGGYTLPTASTTTLGGVKVDGSTININGSGVISSTTIGGGALFSAHASLVAGATSSMGAVSQQGFSASGDGGAATYYWNATSFCPGGTAGSPTTADQLTCLLPAGQAASTPGRFLIAMPSGNLNALSLGFKDDGTDNAGMIATINTILSHSVGVGLNFPANPANTVSNYWFSQPLDLENDVAVSCADGARVLQNPRVNLVFNAGVSGVRFENTGNSYLYPGGGVNVGNISGCGIIGVGFGQSFGAAATAGNAVVPNTRITTPSAIAPGKTQAEPLFSVGDGAAMFPGAFYWNYSGSITGSTLTVTGAVTGFAATTDPGIAVGQMVHGTSVPVGTYILATNAQNPSFTGTGQAGTYQLSQSIAAPLIPSQAQPGTISGSYENEVQTGQPMVPVGTMIAGCSTLSGTHCTGVGGTLTLSTPPTMGVQYKIWVLPGPNTTLAEGSQAYNVTSSLTGQTYPAITAGIASTTMTVTGGAGSLNLGQKIIGGSGSVTGITTTASLTLGETSIPVSSCTGVAAGQFPVAFSGGNQVFYPGTTVISCVGTTLIISQLNLGGAAATTVSGSAVVTGTNSRYSPLMTPIGTPVTGTNIPANTTVVSSGFLPTDATTSTYTLSNTATGSTITASLVFGGALQTPASGLAITFLKGSATILSEGTGAGGNGTYTLDTAFTLAPGSTVYAYDTPSTVYVTGGPRPIRPQDLLWFDGAPFGTVAAYIYGQSPSQQTVVMATSGPYTQVGAITAHAGGSGVAWILPSGLARNTSGNSYGNLINGFGFGINMACAAGNNYPATGCGRSKDSDNFFQFNLVGRFDAGNNSGGSASTFNEYDHNYLIDIAEFSTVGSTYIGEMTQGEDESSNTHDMVAECANNGSSFIGMYASGAQWEFSCTPPSAAQISLLPTPGFQFNWSGAIYGGPADALIVNGVTPAIQVSCPTGSPSASFKVVNGLVTHC